MTTLDVAFLSAPFTSAETLKMRQTFLVFSTYYSYQFIVINYEIFTHDPEINNIEITENFKIP